MAARIGPVLLAAALMPAEPSLARAAEPPAGFTRLFDGTSLAGVEGAGGRQRALEGRGRK
jgi:hypothetical protein